MRGEGRGYECVSGWVPFRGGGSPLTPLSHTHTTHTHTYIHTLSFVCFSDGIGVSPMDLQAADGPDRLSGCVCDVLLHTQHTLIQVNIYI